MHNGQFDQENLIASLWDDCNRNVERSPAIELVKFSNSRMRAARLGRAKCWFSVQCYDIEVFVARQHAVLQNWDVVDGRVVWRRSPDARRIAVLHGVAVDLMVVEQCVSVEKSFRDSSASCIVQSW